MPNVGRPSPACHLCRTRRVKCDLGRPACQRCVKYGVDCPGYRDKEDLIFRPVNPSSTRRSKKEQQRKDGDAAFASFSIAPASPGSTDVDTSSTVPASPDDDDADAQLAMARPLQQHWTAHSVPILLDAYATLGFLSDMYSTYHPDGPLVWAAHLFSRTYVINVSHPTATNADSLADSKRELGLYMGKTLSAVNAALREPDGALRDDVLVTVWILANYELIVGSLGRQGVISPWHFHARGLYTLLKTRGMSRREKPADRTAFWSAFHIVQLNAVVMSTPCPPETTQWLDFVREDNNEGESMPLIAADFMNITTSIQARMLENLHMNNPATAIAEYPPLADRLDRAEARAEDSFAVALPHSADPMDFYWRDIYYAAAVKVYHIRYLYVNYLTHRLGSPFPPEELSRQRGLCLDKVRRAADKILQYTAKVLGAIRGMKETRTPSVLFDSLRLVWPLTCVFIMPTTLPEQKNEAEVALVYIGKTLGVRQALKADRGTFSGRPVVEGQFRLIPDNG